MVISLSSDNPNNPQQSQPTAAGTVKPCEFASPCAQRYEFLGVQRETSR